MLNVKVGLRPIVSRLNLPTVLKTVILPGEIRESLFIATQVGEVFYIKDGAVEVFLDIRPQIIELGASGGYDERGLLGLAFHPDFYDNGLFYLHYSVAGTQGPGAISVSFRPDPCNPDTATLKWTNRESQYDHIDTVEEWILQTNARPQKRRTILNLRRPFFNHNGVNSLNFSPETGRLVLTTGDGGLGYDPFHLSQDDGEVLGKIIEIDVDQDVSFHNLSAVTRFDEIPTAVQETLTVIAKGVRNIPGIAFQRFQNGYVKYVGNVGQDLVESIYSFEQYRPIPVTGLVGDSIRESGANQEGLVNLGWRGWEGVLPTSIIRGCSNERNMDEKTMAYYEEAIQISTKRLQPLVCYFHKEPRQDKFGGTALTGLQPYMGDEIPGLGGGVVFADLARNEGSNPPAKGVLAYTRLDNGCEQKDYGIIDVDYDFGSQSAYYVSLGANLDQTRLYLGVYGSMRVTDSNQGGVFEIIADPNV